MIHIILLILKIIGIMIGVIVGLVLLCICTVLFVPLRYRADAQYDKELQGNASVSWLFHLISIKAEFSSGDWSGSRLIIKILGRSFFDSQENENPSSDNTKTKGRVKKQKKSETGSNRQSRKAAEQTVTAKKLPPQKKVREYPRNPESVPEVPAPSPENMPEEPMHSPEDMPEEPVPSIEEKESPTTASGESQSYSQPGRLKRLWDRLILRIHGIREKITGTKRRFIEKTGHWAQRLNAIAQKKNAVMAILYDKRNRSSFLKIKRTALKVLRHMKPVKFSGNIRFGFDDPAATGGVLGLLSLLYPLCEDRLMLYPEFEHKILQGEVHIAGRLRASVFLFAACRLVFDKDIRRIIASFKNI